MPNFIVGADPVADPPRIDRKRDGRWCLYSGAPVLTTIAGLNEDKAGKPQTIQLIIDLETVSFAAPRIHALSEHNERRQIGHWDNLDAGVAGIYGDLFLVDPELPEEKAYFTDVVKYRALMRNDSPIQVSVGSGGQFELQEKGFACNGRSYPTLDGVPTFVLRGASIYEASLCTFGADDKTGKVAASKTALSNPPPKDNSMLKALLAKYDAKHHGEIARLVAADKTEADVAKYVEDAEKADADALLAEKDAAIAELTAQVETLKAGATTADAQTAELTKEVDTLKARLAARPGAPTKPAHVEVSEPDGSNPKTMTEAMAKVRLTKPDLKGFDLRRAARLAFPQAVEA